jgi:hypothetical protein
MLDSKAPLLWFLLFGCAEPNDPPPIGETGGETGELEPLPSGDDCGPNWYAIDGEMIIDAFGEPEASGGVLVELDAQVEFTWPARPRGCTHRARSIRASRT